MKEENQHDLLTTRTYSKLSSIERNHENRKNTEERITNSLMKKKIKHNFKIYITTFAAIAVFSLVLVSYLKNPINNTYTSAISDEVSQYTGIDLFIPEIEEYPLSVISFRDRLGVVNVEYVKEKDGYFFTSEKEKILFEETQGLTFYHGPYKGETVISINIYKGQANSITRENSHMIQGIEVFYELLDRETPILYIVFVDQDVIYETFHFLSDEYTEQNAFEFIENIVTNLSLLE